MAFEFKWRKGNRCKKKHGFKPLDTSNPQKKRWISCLPALADFAAKEKTTAAKLADSLPVAKQALKEAEASEERGAERLKAKEEELAQGKKAFKDQTQAIVDGNDEWAKADQDLRKNTKEYEAATKELKEDKATLESKQRELSDNMPDIVASHGLTRASGFLQVHRRSKVW